MGLTVLVFKTLPTLKIIIKMPIY